MEIFDFTFNIWALPSLVGVTVNLVLAVLILRQGSQNSANRWFALFLFCLALWGTSEIMGRLSATPVADQFWAKIGPPGWIFMSPIFFTFALIFTRREKLLNYPWFPVVVFLPGLVFLFLAWNTELIVLNDPAKVVPTYYGWDEDPAQFFWLFIIWLEFFFISSLVFLFKYFRRLEDQVKKRQTLIIMLGLLVPLIIGSATDAILPIFKVTVIETAVFFTTVMGLIVSYGIMKYKLFIVSPTTAFYNILNTMTEGLLVLNRDYYIDMANKAIQQMLGYHEDELVGKHIEKIVTDGKNIETFRKKGLEPLKSGTMVRNFETTFLTKDAKVIPVNFSASPIVSKGEKLTGMVVVVSDVTQTKKLVQKLEKAVQELQLSKYELEKKMGTLLQK